MSDTLAKRVGRCVSVGVFVCTCMCAGLQGGGVSFLEAFNISDSLQKRHTQPPCPSWCQRREKSRVSAATSTNGLHCCLYLALSVLLMNEVFCDSQSQCARGMLPYHQVMNECEELFFKTLWFKRTVQWESGPWSPIPLIERVLIEIGWRKHHHDDLLKLKFLWFFPSFEVVLNDLDI